MQQIDFTCPRCGKYYLIYDGKKPITESKYKQLKSITLKQVEIGNCKNCHRKDPNIPTTLEMDGVITLEDIKNRNQVMLQCQICKKWTQMVYDDNKVKYTPCNNVIDKVTQKKCMSMSFDSTSIKSLRTFNEQTDNKRKPKVKKMSPELMKIADEADNPVEALFAALIYSLVEFIFNIMEMFVYLVDEST